MLFYEVRTVEGYQLLYDVSESCGHTLYTIGRLEIDSCHCVV